uniref:Uncharacterized protein n=1 Tax=Arundo donax TaxID=35708 RepID=A0A0A9QGU4_ARUDO
MGRKSYNSQRGQLKSHRAKDNTCPH